MNCDYIIEYFKEYDIKCSEVSANRGIGISLDNINESKPRVHIFVTTRGWAVDTSGVGFNNSPYSQEYSIEEACELANGILHSKYLPLKAEDVEVSVIRGEKGVCQSIKHLPTGLVRMFDATSNGATVAKSKEDAFHSIVTELALNKFA